MSKRMITTAVPKQTTAEVFTERLKSLMARPPVTSQADLAQKMDITRQAVGAWISGKVIPGPMILAALAVHFGTTTDYLLGLSDYTPMKGAPHICGILGCDVDEPFEIAGTQSVIWRIDSSGSVVREPALNATSKRTCPATVLYRVLNDPSMVIHRKDLELDPSMFDDKGERRFLARAIRESGGIWLTRDKANISIWQSLPEEMVAKDGSITFTNGVWKMSAAVAPTAFKAIPMESWWHVRRYVEKESVF